MESIKQLIQNKPSIALQAMVDGLKEQSKRKDFKIRMTTFGESNNKFCYGCAATCTLQKIAGKDLTADNIGLTNDRATFLKFDPIELKSFELAIDEAREGCLYELFNFCGTAVLNKISYYGFRLKTDDWEEQLPIVEKLIKELQTQNL